MALQNFDLPYKSDMISTIREFAIDSLPDARRAAVEVLARLTDDQEADDLGGPTCAALIQAVGKLQKALGLRKLPHDITESLWSYVTF